MSEGRCDCASCCAYRLAIRLALAGLLVLIGVCIHFVVDRTPGASAARIERVR